MRTILERFEALDGQLAGMNPRRGCRSRQLHSDFNATVSIVQFDQMYWVPISASSRSGALVGEMFLQVRLKREAVKHGHASCLKTRTVTPLSDTGHNVWDYQSGKTCQSELVQTEAFPRVALLSTF